MGTVKRTVGKSLGDENRLPPYPPPDERGYYPAIEYMRVSLARSFIQDRRAAGLTRQRLAELAGARESTIARLESGQHSVSVKTIDKIMDVIEAKRAKRKRKAK